MSTLEDIKQKIQRAYHEWEKNTYENSQINRPESKINFTTASFETVEPIYTPLNVNSEDYVGRLGFPGDYPFTRGIYPTMYRSKLWTMRQYAGYGTARESNNRFRYLLAQGQTGLSVAFDLPTQIGYDSDHPASYGEIGKVGVAIDTLADMEILLDEIPLDKVSTSMTINAPAGIMLALYIAVGEKQGIPKPKLTGTIQNDILKEYIARGTYIFPPGPSLRLVTDILKYCENEIPRWNTISISGYHIREAGSTAAQEIGFTLANAITYVDAAVQSGLDVDTIGRRISFFFNSYNDLLEEVAKFRAARRLWSRIMKERFGAKDSRSMILRFHTQTAGSALTAQQIDNNIVRVTIQTLAAVLGGTQSLHTNSRDEALALPTEKSALIALRTQQIVAHESGITNTSDPLGGAYYVEYLTDRLEQEAEKLIARIDQMGGIIEAIESGYIEREIQNSAYQQVKEIENKDRIVVGVNKYVSDDNTVEEMLEVDSKIQDEQIKFLNDIRSKRDSRAVSATLNSLAEAAKGNNNLMPHIIEAVKAYASVGEICDTLRKVFGEYEKQSVI